MQKEGITDPAYDATYVVLLSVYATGEPKVSGIINLIFELAVASMIMSQCHNHV